MTQPLLNVILIAMVSGIALETVVYWHRKTRGTWRDWPAGRSLMYLLLIIGIGFGYGVVNQFFGQYPARPLIGFGLYIGFIAALVIIRFTIRAEMRSGERRHLKTVLPTEDGARQVVVASENDIEGDAR